MCSCEVLQSQKYFRERRESNVCRAVRTAEGDKEVVAHDGHPAEHGHAEVVDEVTDN